MSVALLPHVLSNALLRVSAAWGANPVADPGTWTFTDITADVLQDNGSGISITVGRLNEFATAAPAQLTLRLKNTSGQYTPFSALGSNFPNVVLGTPVKVEISLDGGSTWNTRFQGEAASWLPKWDAQGKFAYVTLTASGITRRLGSGSKPLRSALTRKLTDLAPSVYWPAELSNGNRDLSSPIAGVPALTANSAAFPGAGAAAPGTAELVDLTGGGWLSADLPQVATLTQFRAQFVVRVNDLASGPGPANPLGLVDTTDNAWSVIIAAAGSGGVGFSNFDWDFGSVHNSNVGIDDGLFHEIQVRITSSGSTINLNLLLDGASILTGSWTGTMAPLVAMTSNLGLNQSGVINSIGQFAIWQGSVPTDDTVTAMNGYTGEAVDTRILRLCDEEGITAAITGLASTEMGPQGVDTLMNLLRQCEATDLGVLLDGLGPGLTYVTRDHQLDNDATLTVDANSGQVPAAGPQPRHDDQLIHNRITVTNANGSTVIVEKTDGTLGTATIGVFDDLHSVNTNGDSGLADIAWWLAHLGTVEGLRYPQVSLDFAAAPENAADWLSMIPTDRMDLINMSSQLTQHPLGDVTLAAEGWAEFISSRQWSATVNSANYRGNQVAAVADSTFGRVDTAGSTVHQNYSKGATSILVDVNTGPLWSTAAAPFDVAIRGLEVTVTAISGSSSPQTFTVTALRGDVGGGNAIKLWHPAVVAL